MSEQLEKSKSPKKTVWDWSAMVAVLGAIGTVSMYIVARSYHDGYLKGLGLSSSMFPLQAGDVTILSVVAVFRLALFFFNELIGAGLTGWAKAVFFVLAIIAGWGALNCFEGKVGSGARRVSKWMGKYFGWLSHPIALHWTKPVLCAVAVVYLTVCSLVAVIVLILMLISPFFAVGKNFAKEEFSSEFKDSPLITLRTPDGQDESFRLIQCAAQFCAFYSAGKVVSVPMTDVKWVVSSPKIER